MVCSVKTRKECFPAQLVVNTQQDFICCRHLAAAEGCYSVVQWLLKSQAADPNPTDRFGRTPLEDAVRFLSRHLLSTLTKF